MSAVSNRIRAQQRAQGKTCFDKRVYASEQLALQTRRHSWNWRMLRAVHCPECNAWHLVCQRRVAGKARRW